MYLFLAQFRLKTKELSGLSRVMFSRSGRMHFCLVCGPSDCLYSGAQYSDRQEASVVDYQDAGPAEAIAQVFGHHL